MLNIRILFVFILFVIYAPISIAFADSAILSAETKSIDKEKVDSRTWKQGSFRITKEDGSYLNIQLLRPMWWFKKHQVLVGEEIYLSLPDMGVSGLASVLNVNALDSGFGEVPDDHEVVIGKFTHENVTVIDLYFDTNTEEPLGVTVAHPLWSIDQGGWIDAGNLQIGESVKTIQGIAKLVKREARVGKHTVYNLEVHRRHTFYVSHIGLLVHNTTPCYGKNANKLDANDIGDLLDAGPNWHKGPAKKKYLARFRKQLKGDTNADFYVDKDTREVFLKTNKNGYWIKTGDHL